MVSSKTFYAPSFSSDTLLDAFLNARILVRLAILMQTPPGSVAIDVAFDTDMARREQELTQAAVVAELEIRTKVQCLIWLGTDGQVLEALGVKSADGEVDVYKVRFVLIRLRHVLEETLRRERRGHEDDLKRKFLEKCIKVCEQIVPETEATAQTPYLASASSSSSIITIDADLATGPVIFSNPFSTNSHFDSAWTHEKLREGEEFDQAALDHETAIRITTKAIVDLGTDEDVLEALGVNVVDGVGDVHEVQSVLGDLRRALSRALERGRCGDVDVLKRKFLQKSIRVCENIVSGSGSTVTHSEQVGSSSSSSTSHSSSNTSFQEHIRDLPSDYCSVSSLRFDDADDADVPPNQLLGCTSPPFQPENYLTRQGSRKTSSRLRSWTAIRRAARTMFDKAVSARS
ncbi:hypothetical protein D9758_005346 [Tetrapyrgos nigripes]|uniref:Uncharacterized protein n=1 Tax=Tetrapyrgos nigripes TaxID=182062 RepID=A0A8H5GI63_9AGAR|nr:hypothetical protein D9758_005346 [Tetrapyrgos nigripes]